MNVLVTGGTGFIGGFVVRRLSAEGHRVTVLTRDLERAREKLPVRTEVCKSLDELDVAHAPEVVINLAGLSLGSGRWNDRLKQTFIDSRVQATSKVIDFIASTATKPRLLISGSAVGFYGARGDEPLDESSQPGDEYQTDLCRAWEAEARKAEGHGVRVCLLRMGVVLGRDGGALSSLLPPFRLGLGAWLGRGEQWMSWVHMEDLASVVNHLLGDEHISGPVNATAPHAVSNKEFAAALGGALHRPVFMRVPGWAVRLKVGEMAHLFLTGQKVFPKKLLESGYVFKHARLSDALHDLVM